MKRIHSLAPIAALLCLLLLAGCSASAPEKPAPEETVLEETLPEGTGPEEAAVTLEDLCGADYQTYLTETLTMQMENRMDKTPEVVYFPVREGKPLTDYAAIDETTAFHQDDKGNLVITLPAGTVTDESHGEQQFTVALPG